MAEKINILDSIPEIQDFEQMFELLEEHKPAIPG
jgi:hypothetical protein